MAILRTPQIGCPWDLEQSYETIAPYTIEEAYEVADAIEQGDFDGLKDELGDLLFQVVYHAQMAKEDGQFHFDEVVDAISRKMIRRHPHVFGDETVRQSTDVKGLWERVKAAEKEASGEDKPESLLSDVPLALPGLTRAVKLQNKVAKVGFDWADLTPVLAKLDEEVAELKEVIGQPHDCGTDRIKEELGDVMFCLANLARHLQIDPEDAVRGANAKMVRRFRYIELELMRRGVRLDDASLEEMDRLWDEAKRVEKKSSDA